MVQVLRRTPLSRPTYGMAPEVQLLNASTQTDITFEHIMALAKLRPLTPPVPDTCPFLLSDRYVSLLSPKALLVCRSLSKVGIRKGQTPLKLAVSGTCSSQLRLEIFSPCVRFQLVLGCPCCYPPGYTLQIAELWNQTSQGTVKSLALFSYPSSLYPSRLRILVREITFLTKAARKPH